MQSYGVFLCYPKKLRNFAQLSFISNNYTLTDKMKIALIGYGKMGHMIEQIAISRGHSIVCKIDIDNPDDFDSPAFASADVAIEFTNPTLFWASNFSVGVAIFSAVNRYLAKLMNQFPQYDVAMTETHHVHKLDAPSGTAITLAEEICQNLDRKTEWKKGTTTWDDGRIEGKSAHRDDQLLIDSVRHDEVPGIHSVRYDSEADEITITHSAHSRKGFALGAVLAAEYTLTHNGLLTTSDLFQF